MKVWIDDIRVVKREVELPDCCPECGYELKDGNHVTVKQFTAEEQDIKLATDQGKLVFDEYGTATSFVENQYVTDYCCAECQGPLAEAVDQIIAVMPMAPRPTGDFVKRFAMTPEEVAKHNRSNQPTFEEEGDILLAEIKQEERDAVLEEDEGVQDDDDRDDSIYLKCPGCDSSHPPPRLDDDHCNWCNASPTPGSEDYDPYFWDMHTKLGG